MKSCCYKKDWAINSIIKTKKVYKFPSLPSRRYLISRTSNNVLYREINPFEVSILEQTSWPRVFSALYHGGCIEGAWMGWCVERAGSREEFIQPLRAAKLCAPGMVVVCRNAAVLSHHRAPLVHAHSLLSLFLSFFLFFFILNPWSRFGDNQSEGDRGLESSDSRSESCGRARH